MEPSLKANGRIWVELDGEKVFGPGRAELLERIQVSGSIRQAALQMKMSYKQAWDLIGHMNAKFDTPVVVSHRGGKGGGNAVVTDKGIELITQFRELQVEFKKFLSAKAD